MPSSTFPATTTPIPTGAWSPPSSWATRRTRLGPTSATSTPGTPGARHRAFIPWPPGAITSTRGCGTSARSTSRGRGGRPRRRRSPRRLSCLSQFYDYGIKDAEALEYSPVANVRRPKVSDDSSTIGLTAEELDRLLSAAEAHSPRSAALVSLLVYNGLRIAEVLACDVEPLTHQRGHRVLQILRKGGKASTEPLSAIVARAIDAYVGDRTTGPLFLNADGTERLTYSIAFKLIRGLARRADIAAADRISPHSFRHSFATELLGAGVPLQAVQDAMGHADPSTTPAYDRARHNLDHHATYEMAAHLRRSDRR
jgi:integrase/recombinase XerD